MNKYIAYLLLGCALLVGSDSVHAKSSKKKKGSVAATATTPAKKVTEYDKLFKDKKDVKTVKGLMNLHMVEGKLLAEIPLNLMGKDMMILSVVSEISDHTDSYVGGAPLRPQHIRLSQIGKHIQLRRDRTMSQVEGEQESLEEAIRQSALNSIINSYEIKAYTPDSSAVVIDMTDYFVGDEDLLKGIDMRSESKLGMMGVSYRHSKESSFLDDVQAFDDNVSVKSILTYNASYKEFFRKTTTARMTRTIVLLPEEPMKRRLGDYRIPVNVSGKYNYYTDYQLMKPAYYMNRWRIEPKDAEAYNRGEMVEPIKPIVFYIDTTFTPMLSEAIKAGFYQWNKAFESIGFKNVIQVRPFPTKAEDPTFDPDNFKYSTIRYVPSLDGSVGVKTYTDPRTGEILRSTMLVCHNYVYELPYEIFTFTAHADPAVRQRYMPQSRLAEHITNDIAWKAGTNCFGMTYNLTGSAAYSTEQLRDPEFTQKHGTTNSILDLCKYNWVAPIDAVSKGYRITPLGVGEYDCHVVKCMYKPIPEAKTEQEELAVIEGWIDQHVGDPKYRYENSKDCPDCGANDIGNDDLLNFKYGIEGLKYSMDNFENWVKDEEDPDMFFRRTVYQTLFRRYKQLVTQVANSAYGITTYERKVGDNLPPYKFTPRERQMEAWDILFGEMYMPDWVMRPGFEPYTELRDDRLNSHRDYIFLLASATASRLFMFEGVEGSVGHSEYIKIMYDRFFEKTRKGQNLTGEDRYYQMHFFRSMVASSKLVDKNQKYKDANRKTTAISDEEFFSKAPIFDYSNPQECLRQIEELPIMRDVLSDMNANDPEEIGAQWGELKKWPVINTQVSRHTYYQVLKDMRTLIRAKANTGDKDARMHYRLMLDKLNRLMD